MSKAGSGRPIRFFIMVLGGWTVIRLITVTSGAPNPSPDPADTVGKATSLRQAPLTRHSSGPAAVPEAGSTNWPEPSRKITPATDEDFPRLAARNPVPPRNPMEPASSDDTLRVIEARSAASGTGAAVSTSDPATAAMPIGLSGRVASNRWSGGAWLLWREGSATPAQALPAGRLGGTQAGFRVDYDLAPGASSRPFIYGRVSTALNAPRAPEGAVGLGWQPARSIPISIATERRIALGRGARNAQAVLIAGGFNSSIAAVGLETEGYAQTGMVGLRSRDLFADGKFSLMKAFTGSSVRLGASLSGGAQPGVERLDIGPQLTVRLPTPMIASRIGLEWRERIAGQAAPPSGLAVTLGGDF